ncbi:MAG TPA: GNAT family N-acetyltransferase [Flavipsychrobacter sp.]|nr:GNAT family N-acetyltransferase [Flavipsychrobacter sp.]
MIIRKAKIEDAKDIASFLFLAMEDITYHFIGRENAGEALALLEFLTAQDANQYSYKHTLVAEENGELVGSVTIYNGAKLHELREPVGNLIRLKFNVDFNPEDETQPGEYYLDCIGVKSNQQGKGIGTKLLQFAIKEYVVRRKLTLGLLVDKANPQAKKLYLRSGFKITGEKVLAGKCMEHLQITPESLTYFEEG